jgi:HEAT repeat protein
LAIDTLIEATNYHEWRVRWSAVEALGDVGGERAAGALVEAFEDRDLRVRNAASEALQKIGELSLTPLTTALRHSDKAVRRAARTTLGRIGSPAAQAILRKEQLVSWIPVVVIVMGVLLIIFWLGSMILG